MFAAATRELYFAAAAFKDFLIKSIFEKLLFHGRGYVILWIFTVEKSLLLFEKPGRKSECFFMTGSIYCKILKACAAPDTRKSTESWPLQALEYRSLKIFLR